MHYHEVEQVAIEAQSLIISCQLMQIDITQHCCVTEYSVEAV